jgi:NADH-quinone oxidoreductase E subunit
MSNVLNDAEIQEFEQLKSRYGKPQAILLPVLWRLQEKNGWLDDKAITIAAELAECPKSHVYGVVTFYTMFFDKPMGRYHIMVCTNVSCMLRGGMDIYEAVKSKLGCGHMERTEDGIFSLEEVECMGACGGAPMMAVGETFYENISAADALEIIDTIRQTNMVPKPKATIQLPVVD